MKKNKIILMNFCVSNSFILTQPQKRTNKNMKLKVMEMHL